METGSVFFSASLLASRTSVNCEKGFYIYIYIQYIPFILLFSSHTSVNESQGRLVVRCDVRLHTWLTHSSLIYRSHDRPSVPFCFVRFCSPHLDLNPKRIENENEIESCRCAEPQGSTFGPLTEISRAAARLRRQPSASVEQAEPESDG